MRKIKKVTGQFLSVANLKFRVCFKLPFLSLICGIVVVFPSFATAQISGGSVELNGDTVEYSVDGQTVLAQGDVVITNGDVQMTCDKMEFNQLTQVAYCQGHVRLVSSEGRIYGDRVHFDFKSGRGGMDDARMMSYPYYGAGEKIERVDDHLMLIHDGYMTTSDYDKPEYRLNSKKIEVYPGEKLVARNVTMRLGSVPVLYIPRFTQRLDDEQPRVTFTPGYTKDWGAFLLSNWRYYGTDHVKGTVHLDYRERLDFASGADMEYKTDDFGDGLVRLYYTNERKISAKHLFQEQPSPTTEEERFRGEWRHKWDVDDDTSAIWQYYRLSDSRFLDDYFEGESDEDSSPDTFFLLTRTFPKGTFSARSDVRVNRFESKVERLPELQFNLSNIQLGETGVYFKDKITASNLARKNAAPSDTKLSTMRLDTDYSFSFPTKLGRLSCTPCGGARHTYYTRTKDKTLGSPTRSQLKTGAAVSTHFYRIFEVESDFLGIEINRLRHVITPIVEYTYHNDPTVHADELDFIDSVDAVDNFHSLKFSFENKLQTKRQGQAVDLFRFISSLNYRLEGHPTGGGFDEIEWDTDFNPINWLTLYFDGDYDTRKERLNTANFDLYINGKDNKWRWSVGKRFHHAVDDQFTTSLFYQLNPKWAFNIYERFDLQHGLQKELDVTLTRDLHAWELDIKFNETRGEGSEILLLFRLKAFPGIKFDGGTSFNKRKAGAR